MISGCFSISCDWTDIDIVSKTISEERSLSATFECRAAPIHSLRHSNLSNLNMCLKNCFRICHNRTCRSLFSDEDPKCCKCLATTTWCGSLESRCVFTIHTNIPRCVGKTFSMKSFTNVGFTTNRCAPQICYCSK